MCQALDTQCLLVSELIPAAAQPHTGTYTYADADTFTHVHAHRTHRNTQISTLMCKVHTQMSTHTHSCRLAEMCTHSHTESVSCAQHMPHIQTYTCRDRLVPHTNILQEQSGEQWGTKSHKGGRDIRHISDFQRPGSPARRPGWLSGTE